MIEKDKYWQMYAEVWNNLHKKFIDKIDGTDAFWQEVRDTASQISKKYGECDFIVKLVLNELFEFEKIWKLQEKASG